MAQEDIEKILIKERLCANDGYLSARDIQKALKNMGRILRLQSIHKSMKGLEKMNIIEKRSGKDWPKKYRYNEERLSKIEKEGLKKLVL